jgi:prepilin-type N-terminal cleavage/methylation domain-containing protein
MHTRPQLMMPRPKFGLLQSNKGLTLIEVTAVLIIISIVISITASSFGDRIRFAKYKAVTKEMTILGKAAVDKYVSEGTCPTDMSTLAPTYINTAVISNQFGEPYTISCGNGLVTIISAVPSGAPTLNPEATIWEIIQGSPKDTLKISQRIPSRLSGRVSYDKKYLYGQ